MGRRLPASGEWGLHLACQVQIENDRVGAFFKERNESGSCALSREDLTTVLNRAGLRNPSPVDIVQLLSR